MDTRELIERAERTHRLEAAEIAALLETEADGVETALVAAADRVRRTYVGDGVHLRALVEFSNICAQNCMYCGLRRDNRRIERYGLDVDEIYALAKRARDFGYRTIVLQSGEAARYDDASFAALLRRIKALDLAITLSVGEKSRETYAAYRAAGADRYLLRIETTDRALYARLHPGMDFDNRLRCLRDLKGLGYEVGTGCLIGLPGQTALSLARDLLFFQEIDADMIGIGPFIPNADTPLKAERGGIFRQALRFVALLRLLLPDTNIPATTAMETLVPDGRAAALKAGANVVMPNVADAGSRAKYALYPGKERAQTAPEASRAAMAAQLAAIGRCVADSHGFRKRKIIK